MDSGMLGDRQMRRNTSQWRGEPVPPKSDHCEMDVNKNKDPAGESTAVKSSTLDCHHDQLNNNVDSIVATEGCPGKRRTGDCERVTNKSATPENRGELKRQNGNAVKSRDSTKALSAAIAEQQTQLQESLAMLDEIVKSGDFLSLPRCLHQIVEIYTHEKQYTDALSFIGALECWHKTALAELATMQEHCETAQHTEAWTGSHDAVPALGKVSLPKLCPKDFQIIFTACRTPQARERQQLHVQDEDSLEAPAQDIGPFSCVPEEQPNSGILKLCEALSEPVAQDTMAASVCAAHVTTVAPLKTVPKDMNQEELLQHQAVTMVHQEDPRKMVGVEQNLPEELSNHADYIIPLVLENSLITGVEPCEEQDHLKTPTSGREFGWELTEPPNTECNTSADKAKGVDMMTMQGPLPLNLCASDVTSGETKMEASNGVTMEMSSNDYSQQQQCASDESPSNSDFSDLSVYCTFTSSLITEGDQVDVECSLREESEGIIAEGESSEPRANVLQSKEEEDEKINLDDEARKICIEQVNVPKGLTSILRIRVPGDERVAGGAVKMGLSKRVRFSEPQHSLEQEPEETAGSCLLLLLLMLATVVVSVAGTAAYCRILAVTGGQDTAPEASATCAEFETRAASYYGWLCQTSSQAASWLHQGLALFFVWISDFVTLT
uniref:Consortin C-terminal domain-containing protein n=1 Tax=Eptatretus burgeri TaxID=7764 RepID=A0A8C4QL52_EPTBU